MSPAPGSPLHDAGPKGPIGSVVNVIMCGGLIVFAVTAGIVQSMPPFFFIAAIGVFIEIQFVRIMLRAVRRTRETDAATDRVDASTRD
ncbi:MAG: hypothetical protein EPO52_13995 [Herbiconiux sp.]|uniref:hypothetical protein n=1 Tax=Herbiconiux sp. TaxID=1871186 RepID=UPI0011FAD1C9|nr:hypothetical protein [Herbiconiux sp.]TAJ46666.1 MAG: hypothetical protein EPO52_13995 [Herbiconiux sp.]